MKDDEKDGKDDPVPVDEEMDKKKEKPQEKEPVKEPVPVKEDELSKLEELMNMASANNAQKAPPVVEQPPIIPLRDMMEESMQMHSESRQVHTYIETVSSRHAHSTLHHRMISPRCTGALTPDRCHQSMVC